MGRDFQSLTTEENPIAQAFLEILEPSRERLLVLGLYFCLRECLSSQCRRPGLSKLAL